jgi:hypothetical protein
VDTPQTAIHELGDRQTKRAARRSPQGGASRRWRPPSRSSLESPGRHTRNSQPLTMNAIGLNTALLSAFHGPDFFEAQSVPGSTGEGDRESGHSVARGLMTAGNWRPAHYVVLEAVQSRIRLLPPGTAPEHGSNQVLPDKRATASQPSASGLLVGETATKLMCIITNLVYIIHINR